MQRFGFVRYGAVLAAIFGVLGCTGISGIGGPTPPSRFYLLAALEPLTTPADGPVLGVGPVRLAEYLDRPQIATRRGAHVLHLAEYDRWGAPLADSVSRVLAANLAALLRTDRVRRHPWRDARAIDAQIELDLLRFDGPLAGPVELAARWRVSGRGSEREQITRHSEPLDGQGYAAHAAALSRALQVLSREIAAAIAP